MAGAFSFAWLFHTCSCSGTVFREPAGYGTSASPACHEFTKGAPCVGILLLQEAERYFEDLVDMAGDSPDMAPNTVTYAALISGEMGGAAAAGVLGAGEGRRMLLRRGLWSSACAVAGALYFLPSLHLHAPSAPLLEIA